MTSKTINVTAIKHMTRPTKKSAQSLLLTMQQRQTFNVEVLENSFVDKLIETNFIPPNHLHKFSKCRQQHTKTYVV